MLRDITLGQFFPGSSLIHRLDPRVKLCLSVLYITALFLARGFIAYGLMLIWLTLGIMLSRLKLKALVRGLKPLLFILAFTALLNAFYTPGRELFHIWIFSITEEGLTTAGFMLARIIMLIFGTFLLTYTTSPVTLTDALERLMKPLKLIKIPVHELSMMMMIALSFIPTLIEETDMIISAQKSRGADFESGGLISRAKALVPLLVPLFVSAFRHAEDLTVAMESRCYHGGEGRTKLRVMRLELKDVLSAVFCALMTAAVCLV